MGSPESEYSSRLEARRVTAAASRVLEGRHSLARLGIFVGGLVLTWFIVVPKSVAPEWIFAPIVLFGVFVIRHGQAKNDRVQAERAVAYYERGLSRMRGSWDGGSRGDAFLDVHHPYAQDLDLFGKGSLFELLAVTRTRTAERILARWLKTPAVPVDIRRRQAAVDELRPAIQLREELSLLGEDLQSRVDPAALDAWCTTATPPIPVAVRAIAAFISAGVIVTAVGAIAGWTRPIALVVFIAASLVFQVVTRRRVSEIISGIGKHAAELGLISEVAARLEREQFTCPLLADLRKDLGSEGRSPSRLIEQLRRKVALVDSGHNELIALFAIVLLTEPQLAFAIEAWRQRHAARVPQWLRAMGEIEALSAISGYAYENPSDPFPEFVDGPPRFEGEALGHPLIAAARCVRNDCRLDAAPQSLVVSGSNMSGKSTYLRTVGINAVLAQAGAPVRAKRLLLTPLQVGASINRQDSLMEGTSRFYAEIKRLKQISELTKGGPVLFLVDEVLNGTNSHDRQIGAEAVVRGLVQRGAIGLVTTHDLSLAKVAEALAPKVANVHFEDHLEDGKMVFDYKLKPGVVQKSNALELMRGLGLDV